MVARASQGRRPLRLARLALLAPAAAIALGVIAIVAGVVAWPCPLHALAGVPCPTCGMTRALRLALHGEFAAATRMHPLWAVVAPAGGGLLLAETASFARTGEWGREVERRAVKWALGAVLAALLIVWIARFFGAFGGPAA